MCKVKSKEEDIVAVLFGSFKNHGYLIFFFRFQTNILKKSALIQIWQSLQPILHALYKPQPPASPTHTPYVYDTDA